MPVDVMTLIVSIFFIGTERLYRMPHHKLSQEVHSTTSDLQGQNHVLRNVDGMEQESVENVLLIARADVEGSPLILLSN